MTNKAPSPKFKKNSALNFEFRILLDIWILNLSFLFFNYRENVVFLGNQIVLTVDFNLIGTVF